MNNVTNTSQITGHVQGSTMFPIARTPKESQKAKQRVVSRMQGIYDVCLSVSFKSSLPVTHLEVFSVIETCSNIEL